MPKNTVNESDTLTTLLSVSRNVVGTLDLQKILQETVDGASSLFDWGTAAIYLLEGPDHVKLHATCPELPPDFPENLKYCNLSDHKCLERAIRTARPVLVADTHQADLSEGERMAISARQLRTEYFVPLVSDEGVLGAFIVGASNEPATLTEQDTNLADALANFAVLAIRNARLFEEKNAYTTELERTIEQRDAAETEQRRLQAELFQVQKLDAIGQLAGGIAHDFNNQLGGILGYAELLKRNLHDENLVHCAEQIATLATRSAELNSKLLAFSRKGKFQKTPVDLHQIVQEVSEILSHTISPRIELHHDLEASSFHTEGDPVQIQNALLNLAINARDAMPEGGRLCFETEPYTCLTNDLKMGPFTLTTGEYVRVTVRDSGTGMEPETMARMYEPFFTTKKRGKGTGMGLPAVFGTMQSHAGAIDVESQLDHGTAFHLFFPLIHTTRDGSEENVGTEVGGPGTGEILVIDDEEVIVEITSLQLDEAGYVAHGFTSPPEALEFFKEAHSRISVVLLDMLMPKISGPTVFAELKKINPDIPIVLMSGFSEKNEVQALMNAGARDFIQKPFHFEKLLDLLRNL